MFLGLSFLLMVATSPIWPRRLALIVIVVIGAAIGLELLQALVASRHARLGDMGFKLIGGGLGILFGVTATSVARRYWTRRA